MLFRHATRAAGTFGSAVAVDVRRQASNTVRIKVVGSMPEWFMGADCKSADARQRWFKSSSAQDIKSTPVALLGFARHPRGCARQRSAEHPWGLHLWDSMALLRMGLLSAHAQQCHRIPTSTKPRFAMTS